MTGVKLVMIFPNPIDLEAFEAAYAAQQLPLLLAQLNGQTKGTLTRVLGAPDGHPRFCRMVEIYFTSQEALHASLASREGQAVAAQAIAISSGGTPIFLICDEVALASA
jgi:uncharacterized protein (TIGR02118 family)